MRLRDLVTGRLSDVAGRTIETTGTIEIAETIQSYPHRIVTIFLLVLLKILNYGYKESFRI